jgi:hypothetical protein
LILLPFLRSLGTLGSPNLKLKFKIKLGELSIWDLSYILNFDTSPIFKILRNLRIPKFKNKFKIKLGELSIWDLSYIYN